MSPSALAAGVGSALGLIALSALAFGAAFPPLRWHALGWIALAPLLVVVRRAGPRAAAGWAALWTVLAAYAVGDWMPRAVTNYYEQAPWVGWAFFFGCALVMAAPYYAAAAWAIRRLCPPQDSASPIPAWCGPWLVAAAWTAAELGRGRLLTGTPFLIGNPWALLGYSQIGFEPAIQIASWAGVYGISFAMVSCNAGLAECAIAALSRRRPAPALLAASLLPAALVLVFGWASLRAYEPEPLERETGLAVVQGNLDSNARWRSDLYGENLGIYLQLSRAALERVPGTQLVIWPEAAMTFFLEDEDLYRLSIARVIADAGAELVAGGTRHEGRGEDQRYFNTVFWLDREGEIGARTDKQYLVPFSEAFPFGSIEWLRRRFERVRTFSPADETRPLPTVAGPVAVVICNEAMLPEVVSDRVAQGAEWILNPSNDTWIPEARFAEQQLDIVTLRAVEQGRWLIRSSTAGPSAVIDPRGRVLGRTELGERRLLMGPVARRDGRTVYSHVGDAFAFFCVGGVTGALLWVRRGRRAASEPDS